MPDEEKQIPYAGYGTDDRECLVPISQLKNIFKPMPDNLTVEQIKQKAKDLKSIIEAALKSFKDQTGYVPDVKIETREHPTNDRKIINQSVTVTIQM